MRISVLGPIRLELGPAGEVGAGRQQALLIRLVAANGRVVSTDRLIDDLWHGEPPPKALAALQVHVSNLRRILEPDRPPRAPARILVSEQPGYAVRVPREAVDAWEFDALLAVDTAADPTTRHRRLTAALAMWRGEPFGAYAGEPWAVTEVTRLHALRLSAVERRAAAALETGHPDEVADTLPAECATHPDREELFRLLALAQYRLGRQADALTTLRTVRTYLSDELGVDPTPALRKLESDILAHAPELTPDLTQSAAGTTGVRDAAPRGNGATPTRDTSGDASEGFTPPTARDSATVDTREGSPRSSGNTATPNTADFGRSTPPDSAGFTSPNAGDTAASHTTGAAPSNSGIAEPTADVAGSTKGGHTPSYAGSGVSPDAGGTIPLGTNGFDSRSTAGDQAGAARFAERREFAGRETELATLTRIADTVATEGLRLVWIAAEAGGGKSTLAQTLAARLIAQRWTVAVAHCPEVDGAPAAWAWRELLGGLGHGADVDDPFGIAREVVAACRGHRDGVLLVVDDAHRADSATLQVLRQTIAWMRELPVLVVATFRPSEAGAELPATAAALISVTADRLELAGLSDDGIVEVAGSAGLAEPDPATVELLRERTGGNPLFVRELAKWIASNGPRDAHTSVPSGIRDVLLRRVDRLPADVGRMLRLISVCGRGVAIDTLLALWSDAGAADEDQLLDAVDTAVVAGLLRADADRVDFQHVLVRDAVHDSVPALRRRRMHWRTLSYLESLPRPDLDELAFHAAHGASPATTEQAIAHVEAAARARFESGFRADSAPLWRDAVALRDGAGHDATPADRACLVAALCALVTALAHRGEVAEARGRRGRALALAEGDERLVRLALTCWRTPRIWTTRQQRLPDTQMTAALSRALPAATGVDRVLLLVTAVFEFEGNDGPFALACATEAVELVRGIDDPEATCAALNALAFMALGPDLKDRLPDITRAFLDAAGESGNVAYLAAAHYYRFLAYLSRGDLLAASTEVTRALETASSGRVGELIVVLSAFDAVLDVLRGDLDGAAARYAALAARLSAAGLANAAEIGLVGEMVVAWFRGSLAHLAEPLAEQYKHAPQTISWVYVLALVDAGREAEARVIAERDHEVSRDFYWTAMSAFHARALVRLGMRDRAAELYRELRHCAGTVAGLDSASVAMGPMDTVLAELADLLGDPEAAAAHRAGARRVDAEIAASLAALDAHR
ncbi:BTAD domain-containing putative transcriptional regulator [Nocardia bovistercoris]|uniref:BTAD domain-containing putative transcriptional regulator n=1 Tax=Nocardia bovistercoris TaxID=2785916 RepID=UPI002FCCC368